MPHLLYLFIFLGFFYFVLLRLGGGAHKLNCSLAEEEKKKKRKKKKIKHVAFSGRHADPFRRRWVLFFGFFYESGVIYDIRIHTAIIKIIIIL